MHVSDQGSHFKDTVIKEFNRILQINHNMTTAYSPLENGTVEQVNNDIQKLLASFDSVTLESFAISVSSKLCPFQDHDRSGCVQPPVNTI
jgi:hypothetical protein